MKIRVTQQHTAKSGQVLSPGEVLEVDDAEAYGLIHGGQAAPPLRYHAIDEETGCSAGFVDRPGSFRGDVPGFEAVAAVVPARTEELRVGAILLVLTAGKVSWQPSVLAADVVAAGGRYAEPRDGELPPVPADISRYVKIAAHPAVLAASVVRPAGLPPAA